MDNFAVEKSGRENLQDPSPFEENMNAFDEFDFPDLSGGEGGLLALAAHHVLSKKKDVTNHMNRQ